MQAWLEAKQRPGGRGLSGVVRRLLEDAWRREQDAAAEQEWGGVHRYVKEHGDDA